MFASISYGHGDFNSTPRTSQLFFISSNDDHEGYRYAGLEANATCELDEHDIAGNQAVVFPEAQNIYIYKWHTFCSFIQSWIE